MGKQLYNIYELEYITEIAFIIGEHNIKDIMTEVENDRQIMLDYDDFTNFCIYILREAETKEDKLTSLLNIINDLIGTKYKTIKMYEQFLDQYQIN